MGAYRILRRVSLPGGYLETSAGRQVGTDRPVWLSHLSSPPSSLERLVESLRALQSPSIPSVVEVGSSGDGLWIVTEATEGESLRWLMSTLARASGFIAPNEGLAVVARVASALGRLHGQRLAHGDVCPSTIFLTTSGEVQLHDGAIAATLSPLEDQGPWRTEVNSLAPEQVSGAATPESDVFRLGLVLYELAVGRPLWSGPSPAHLCHAASVWLGLTREKVRQVPEPWLTLLVTMLSVEPGARPTMEEVVEVLDQAVKANGWSISDEDIAKLLARASQGRISPFTPDGAPPRDLTLGPLTPAGGSPAVTPPGAVVARIATKKMTREMLAVMRSDPLEAPAPTRADATLEMRVLDLLVERGRITPAQVTSAREACEAKGGTPGRFLVSDGALDEDSLVAVTAELTRTPSVTARKLTEATPSAEALALLPRALSLCTNSVPLGLKGAQLMVAMGDPMDARALEQLKAALGARSLITFRAGERALAEARSRLYPADDAPPAQAAPVAPSWDLPTRLIDSLLSVQGQRGVQGLQLINLAIALARRLGVSPAEVTQAGLAARAMVTGALAAGRLPFEVPRLAELQERLGLAPEVDPFVEALRAFPLRVPEEPGVKAVVLAFAFAAHVGEARPSENRLGGALSSFRTRHQLAPALFELLSAELSR